MSRSSIAAFTESALVGPGELVKYVSANRLESGEVELSARDRDGRVVVVRMDPLAWDTFARRVTLDFVERA